MFYFDMDIKHSLIKENFINMQILMNQFVKSLKYLLVISQFLQQFLRKL